MSARPEDIFSPEEIQELTRKGAEAAKGHEIEIPPQPKEALREFVLGYVAGRVTLDRDVPPNLVGMVFMPLLFGALQPKGEAEEALNTVLLDVGEEPEIGDPPEPPELPPEPKKPTQPKPLVPEPRPNALSWGGFPLGPSSDLRQEDRSAYLAKIEKLNGARQTKYEARLRKWEKAHVNWMRAGLNQEKDHALRLAEHEAAIARFGSDHETWERKSTQNEALRRGFMEQFASPLGCVWEDISKAGPRGINGYPIFMSCRLMNKDDFTRAAKAVNRELERVRALEV